MSVEPIVSLRDNGLYCPAGDFYIDPWLPVERALITHAHGDHASGGSGSYLASEQSVPLLNIRLGRDAKVDGIPYGERRQIGGATVSFHSAGHVLGSAQIRIEVGGEVWVVSGDYKRAADPTCAPFEPVTCDVFITEATFAAPIYRWQPGVETAREILDWWRACAADGSTALLFCYALGKSQRVLAELHGLLKDEGELPTVLIHGAMEALTEAYRKAGIAMLPTKRLEDQATRKKRGGEDEPLAGRLVVAPPSAYRSPWMKRFTKLETGFASGWVRVRGALRQRGHDRGFVLSDHADWPELVRTIRETGAKKVLVTHGRTDLLVRWLAREGIAAQALSTTYGDEEEG